MQTPSSTPRRRPHTPLSNLEENRNMLEPSRPVLPPLHCRACGGKHSIEQCSITPVLTELYEEACRQRPQVSPDIMRGGRCKICGSGHHITDYCRLLCFLLCVATQLFERDLLRLSTSTPNEIQDAYFDKIRKCMGDLAQEPGNLRLQGLALPDDAQLPAVTRTFCVTGQPVSSKQYGAAVEVQEEGPRQGGKRKGAKKTIKDFLIPGQRVGSGLYQMKWKRAADSKKYVVRLIGESGLEEPVDKYPLKWSPLPNTFNATLQSMLILGEGCARKVCGHALTDFGHLVIGHVLWLTVVGAPRVRS